LAPAHETAGPRTSAQNKLALGASHTGDSPTRQTGPIARRYAGSQTLLDCT